MAQQIAQDAVKEAQSMGEFSPIGVTATTNHSITAGDGLVIFDAPNLDLQVQNALATHSSKLQDSEQRTPNGIVPRHLTEEISEVRSSLVTVRRHSLSVQPGNDAKEYGNIDALSVDKEVYVNGVTEEQHLPPDVQPQQKLGDGSGGSDTDTSKGDGSENHRDGVAQHSRSASIKKPVSFKPVSVTKNFLAKTATAVPSLRGGDKGSDKITACDNYHLIANRSIAVSNGQGLSNAGSTAKPRLIAKSVSNSTAPRQGASNANGNGSGPDASKVWNKNRRTSLNPVM